MQEEEKMRTIRTADDWINLLNENEAFLCSNPYWDKIPVAERTFEILSKHAQETLKNEHDIYADIDDESLSQIKRIARQATVVILTAPENVIVDALKNAMADEEYIETCKQSCNWITTLFIQLIKVKDYSDAIKMLNHIQNSNYDDFEQLTLVSRLQKAVTILIVFANQELSKAGTNIKCETIEEAKKYFDEIKEINPDLEELIRKTHKLYSEIKVLNISLILVSIFNL